MYKPWEPLILCLDPRAATKAFIQDHCGRFLLTV